MPKKPDPVYTAQLCRRMIKVVDYLIRRHPDVLNITHVLDNLGASRVAYLRWAKGESSPSAEHLMFLVHYYHVRPEFLLTGKGEIIPEKLLPSTGLNGMGKRFKVIKRKRRSRSEMHGKKPVRVP